MLHIATLCLSPQLTYTCVQTSKSGVPDVVRVFLQTPTGSCHVDITTAILQSHLQVCSVL